MKGVRLQIFSEGLPKWMYRMTNGEVGGPTFETEIRRGG